MGNYNINNRSTTHCVPSNDKFLVFIRHSATKTMRAHYLNTLPPHANYIITYLHNLHTPCIPSPPIHYTYHVGTQPAVLPCVFHQEVVAYVRNSDNRQIVDTAVIRARVVYEVVTVNLV